MSGRSIVVEILAESKDYVEKLGAAEHATTSLGDKLNKGLKVASAAALGGLVAIGKVGWDNIQENADATASLSDALSRSSKALNDQREAAAKNNEELSKHTKFSVADLTNMDTVIAKNQALSGVISNGTTSYADLTTTTADLATVMKTDGSSAAELLGKALAKPETASKSLLAAGIVLTDKQKEQIKTWDKAGESAKSQGLILDLVKKKTEGAADAAGNTLSGKLTIAKHSFEEMSGQLLTAVLPAITDLVGLAQKVSTWMQDNGTKVKIAAGIIGGLAVTVWAVNGAQKAWKATTEAFTVVQKAMNVELFGCPVVLIAAGIIALGAALIYAYEHCKTFRDIVNAAFHAVQTVVGDVVSFIKSHWQLLLAIITGPVGAAVILVVSHFDTIKSKVSSVVDGVKSAFSTVEHAIAAPFEAAFGAIKSAWNSTIGGFGIHIPSILGFGGASFTIPTMAAGGVAAGGMPIIVGEHGPEMFTPGMTGRVVPNHTLAGTGTGGSNNPIHIHLILDKREVAEVVYEGLVDRKRRTGSLGLA
jgi:hypothetical protein